MGLVCSKISCLKKDNINLNNIDPSSIQSFNLKGKIYDCIVDSNDISNGDTLKVVFIRNNEIMKLSLRLNGIDTPEINLPMIKIPKNKFIDMDTISKLTDDRIYRNKEIKKAIESRDALKSHIQNKTLQVEFIGPNNIFNFNNIAWQVIGILYIITPNGKENVNQWMLDNKYARSYNGGERKKWIFKNKKTHNIFKIKEEMQEIKHVSNEEEMQEIKHVSNEEEMQEIKHESDEDMLQNEEKYTVNTCRKKRKISKINDEDDNFILINV